MPNTELLADESLSKKLIQKWFWLYFFTYLAAPAGYLIRIIISNSVSVAEVWILYSIISFVQLISIYNDVWLTESLKYFIPRYWIKKQYNYVKTSIIVSLGIQLSTGFIIAIILRFWSWWLATNYFQSELAEKILKIFCLYFLGINIFQVTQSIFIAFQDTYNSQIIAFIKQWWVAIFTLTFFLLWWANTINYSIAWIIWLWCGVIASIFLVYKHYRQIFTMWKLIKDNNMINEYAKYALWTFLWSNAYILLSQIDQQMVITLLGPESAWYFANYLSLFAINWIIIAPIFSLLFPIISELIVKEDFKKVSQLQNFLYSYMSIFAISLWTLFLVLWNEMALVFYWIKFIYSWRLLSIHWVFLLFSIISWINFVILGWNWKVKEKVIIILITWILNIIMNYLFINMRWLTWVVLATIINSFIMAYRWYLCVFEKSKISMQRHNILKNISLISILWYIIFTTKKYVFNYSDVFRYQNLLILCSIWIVYYILISILNWKRIVLLKKEIQKI
jgi:O-antigen/teichoic acid export membrane protein